MAAVSVQVKAVRSMADGRIIIDWSDKTSNEFRNLQAIQDWVDGFDIDDAKRLLAAYVIGRDRTGKNLPLVKRLSIDFTKPNPFTFA